MSAELDFKFKIKIYYEDTDSGGVVYYANYLKFLERARTEMISSVGLSNKKLLDDYETLIIVKSCKIEYKKPIKLEDEIIVKSKIKSVSRSSFIMEQIIEKDGILTSEAEIVLVTVNKSGKPVKIPDILEKYLMYLQKQNMCDKSLNHLLLRLISTLLMLEIFNPSKA